MGWDRHKLLCDGMGWDRQICPMDNPGKVPLGFGCQILSLSHSSVAMEGLLGA